MWTNDKNFAARGFSTPPPTWKSKRLSPMMPASEKKRSSPKAKADIFHVIHKVPAGDSPYVRAKHVQLIDKDPNKAISLFWSAINSGDRVDSALKDMAVVMKQLNRSDEAIEAIKSFRHLCPPESQESLDNVLVELYKRSGRIEEQIEMLQLKLKHIEEGVAFGGKRTKTARSQGKKIQITIEQEYSRLLGNLAWAYLQQNNYKPAEELYRKALSLESDKNKQCNLAICLMHMNRMTEAKFLLQTIRDSSEDGPMDESYAKSFERAIQVLTELESQSIVKPIAVEEKGHKKEFSTSISGGQNHVSGSGVSKRLAYGHQETVQLGIQISGSCFLEQHENKNNFYGSDKGISKCTSFGSRNASQFSPESSSVNKLKKGCYTDNLYERRADLSIRRKDNWVGMAGMEVGSTCNKAYASPLPLREFPKAPFTQPRRCSWSFNNGDRRRALVRNDTVGPDQTTATENLQVPANQNHDGQLQASTKETLQKSKSCSPSISQDCICLWEDCAEVNNEYVLRPIVNGDWKLNSWGNNGYKNLVMRESNLPTKSSVAFDYARAREASSDADREWISDIPIAGGVRLTEVKPIAENIKSTQELQCLSQPNAENLQHPQEFLMCKSKKNWADMVEEDEQELFSGKTDCLDNECFHLSEESSYYFKTSSLCSDGQDGGEEFNDENVNANIICQTHSPSDQIENISRKIESFNLKDGYYTQPQNDASSMNRVVRRALCFNQQQKPDRRGYNFCSSPIPKKTLNFEGFNSSLENEPECTSGNSTKLLRRNRLQVFRDITPSPESPQP
ncbi:hypothetical protein F0562_013588 [Nyssa sinensis]|uniref:Uncharacterized protein n=1 Tax=Nyssa sinensis TaxID=561372 RepID=A0A5J4ZKL3_9ASTE|nr:hypothetical protein F0562_013588 [Nyssa sinensis]